MLSNKIMMKLENDCQDVLFEATMAQLTGFANMAFMAFSQLSLDFRFSFANPEFIVFML